MLTTYIGMNIKNIPLRPLPSMKLDLDSDSDSEKPSSVVTTPTSAGSQHSYRYHGTTSPRARDIENNGMLKVGY